MACNHQGGGSIDQNRIAIGPGFSRQKPLERRGIIGRIATAQRLWRMAGQAKVFGLARMGCAPRVRQVLGPQTEISSKGSSPATSMAES